MSKRRHYSENFNSDDYPTDVLTYIPKDWKTPISEMKSKYKMPGGKPRNYQYRNSETNLILQDLYQQQENIRFNDPNGTKNLYLNLNPLMISEYMDQYKTRRASDSEFYQRPPNMSSYYPAAMEDYNEPISYWNPSGYASQFGRCCCFTRPIEDN